METLNRGHERLIFAIVCQYCRCAATDSQSAPEPYHHTQLSVRAGSQGGMVPSGWAFTLTLQAESPKSKLVIIVEVASVEAVVTVVIVIV